MVYTIELTQEQVNTIIAKYKDFKTDTTNEFQSFRFKVGSTTATIFNTNKIVIQGSNPDSLYKEISDLVGSVAMLKEYKKKDIVTPTFNFSIVGTDEVGTGDYFGPIVVSACFTKADEQLILKKMGIKDSKKIKDDKILELGEYLLKNTINASVILSNEQYNEITKQDGMNMNKIKALLHNRAINNILKKEIHFDKIVIDAFCSYDNYSKYIKDAKDKYLSVELIEKAEDKFVSVGCASILARYHFLKAFDKMCEESGYKLPKGAGKEVDQMIKKIKKDGNEALLQKIAKVNFVNTTK